MSTPTTTTETGPRFIVLGMAPGRVEDAKGVPFTGPAGTLLRNELRRVGLDSTAAYYINVVSCAPPNNKMLPEHINACRQNLKDQLDAANTTWILALGNQAIEALIPHATTHTKGKKIAVHDHLVFCTFHPSYILRAKDRGVYLSWKEDIAIFRMLMENPGIAEMIDHMNNCMYCGREETAQRIPVCSKCMGKWRRDRMWKYAPPEQMSLELTEPIA